VSANDWALFRQIIGRSCSQQQLAVYVQQLSEPGELAVDWGGGWTAPLNCSVALSRQSWGAAEGGSSSWVRMCSSSCHNQADGNCVRLAGAVGGGGGIMHCSVLTDPNAKLQPTAAGSPCAAAAANWACNDMPAL
jgi:hypothetical protein